MRPNPEHKRRRIDRSAEVSQVLVVEDNAVTAEVIQFYLERGGFQVTVAYDGREALCLLDNGRFDLVVTDYRLPLLNGRALCQEMRRSDQYRRIPVVMLTAKGAGLDLYELRTELELIDIFSKPFSPMALVRSIQSCLGPDTN